jgi:hypothetical protein
MVEYWLIGISIVWMVVSWLFIKPGHDIGQAMPISGMFYLFINIPSFLMFVIGLGMILYSISRWLLLAELALVVIFVVPRIPAIIMVSMMFFAYFTIFAREFFERWKSK